MDKLRFIIEMTHNGKNWFFHDIDTSVVPHIVKWVKNRRDAYMFDDDQGAEMLIGEFLTHQETQIIIIKGE